MTLAVRSSPEGESTALEMLQALQLFRRWLREAEAEECHDPATMVLATATCDGTPSARMVLLKDCNDRGFVFYTNLGSRKAQELRANPQAALLFDWAKAGRRVEIAGRAEPLRAQEADAYFARRPALSRIGAWASRQSEPLGSRLHLWLRIARFTAIWATGRLARPKFWSGFRVIPSEIRFQEQGGPVRLVGTDDAVNPAGT